MKTLPTRMAPAAQPARQQSRAYTRTLVTVLAVILVTAVGVIGASVSFQTIDDLVRRLAMPGPAPVYPIGIDVGILAFVLADWMYTLHGRTALHLRLIAWALTAFTVWANAHGTAHVTGLDGSDHNVQVGFHVVMPLLWVAGVEAFRHLVARGARAAAGTGDTIPVARWILSPLRTMLLYRRMRLWQIRSYTLALAYEDARLYGIDIVRARQGILWRLPGIGQTPRALRTRLTTGTLPGTVREAIGALVAADRDAGWEPVVAAWVNDALATSPQTATPQPAADPEAAPPVETGRTPLVWNPIPAVLPAPAARPQAEADPVAEAAAAALAAPPTGARSAAPRRRTGRSRAKTKTGKIDLSGMTEEQIADTIAAIAADYEDAHGQMCSVNEVMRRVAARQSRAKELLDAHYAAHPYRPTLHAVHL